MARLGTRVAMRLLRWTAPTLAGTLTEMAHQDRYVREWVLPKNLDRRSVTSYVPDDFFGHEGVELDVNEQLERTNRWRNSWNEVFCPLRSDPVINPQFLGKDYLHNGYYCTPDAEIYACMIADARPVHIVEIGGGFSTLIAKAVCSRLRLDTRITVVDPEPRSDVVSAAHSVIRKPVEEVDPDTLPLGRESLLFVDSSHITRAGGDVPFIYNKLIPGLPDGTLVHVHDIYIPYDYPAMYQKRLYTEQYVLHALLSHSRRYRVVYATHLMVRTYPKVMQSVFGDIVGTHDWFYGCAFWLKVSQA